MRVSFCVVAVVIAGIADPVAADQSLMPGLADGGARGLGFGSENPLIGESNGTKLYRAGPQARALYEQLLSFRNDGGGGSVDACEVLQTNYNSIDGTNIVLCIWDALTPNLSGVTLRLLDAEQNEVANFPLAEQDVGVPTFIAFQQGLPAGTFTFRIEGAGDPAICDIVREIVDDQPFSDPENVTCSEGALAADGNCEIIVQWDQPPSPPTRYSILLNGATVDSVLGTATSVALSGNPAGDYEVIVLPFLERPNGFFRGGRITGMCTIECLGEACAAPASLQLCQYAYSADNPLGNGIRATWVNRGTYDAIDVFVDGTSFATLDGAADGTVVIGATLPVGEHTISLEAVCPDGVLPPVEATINILGETPVPEAVTDLACEFFPADDVNPNRTVVTWTNADPAPAFFDVWVVIPDGTVFYLGALMGGEGVTINNAALEDTIVLQFFRIDENGSYGSDQLSCNPSDSAGNEFVRSVCQGSGGGPQITSAVFGLNWLFAGGAAPPCLAACDADNDGQVAINDMVYILNFLFGGGPPPANWIDGNPVCETATPAECETANESCPL